MAVQVGLQRLVVFLSSHDLAPELLARARQTSEKIATKGPLAIAEATGAPPITREAHVADEEAVATLLSERSIPALYRVHGPVNLVRMNELIDLADAPALRFAPFEPAWSDFLPAYAQPPSPAHRRVRPPRR